MRNKTMIQIDKPYGYYLIPDDWKEKEYYCKDEQYVSVFCPRTESQERHYSNVSVLARASQYTLSEHNIFKSIIVSQLESKARVLGFDWVTGMGSFNKTGYPVYRFSMVKKDEEAISQYYIIGEKRFCMMQLTDYSNEQQCSYETILRDMMESFVWN